MDFKNLPPLIFDRDAEDVNRAKAIKEKVIARQKLTSKESEEWNAGLRGALNYTDFNRVVKWIQAVSDKMREAGKDPGLGTWKEWKPTDFIFFKDLDRIRRAVESLRDGLYEIPDWRDLAHNDTMSLEQLNALEWDLQRCAEWIERLTGSYLRCGQPYLYSGSAFYFPEPSSINPTRPSAPREKRSRTSIPLKEETLN